MGKQMMRSAALALLCVWCAFALAGAADEVSDLVAKLKDASEDVRTEAAKNAGPVGAKAVPAIADLKASADPEVALKAELALVRIVAYAGRPGADADRAAVAAALASLLDPARPVPVRQDILNHLSILAGDAEVPAIAALLADPALGEDARIALDRVPGEAANNAFLEALAKVPADTKGRILASLARRGAKAAIPALTEEARSGDPARVWPALDGLAKLGVAPSEVLPNPPEGKPGDKARYVAVALKAADAKAGAGDTPAAEGIYVGVATLNGRPDQTCAALVGLCGIQSPKLIPQAIGYLGEPAVRGTSIQVLKASPLPETDALLAKAYPSVIPPYRTALLQVLAARKSPELAALLEAAKKDESAEVRVAAAVAAGQEPADADLIEAAQKGSVWAREEAAAQCLAVAAARREASNIEGARTLLEALLPGDVSNATKTAAFTALGEIASPASQAVMDEALAKNGFAKGTDGADALTLAMGNAFVAVTAKNPDKNVAIDRLTKLLDSPLPADLKTAAINKLGELGVDTKSIAGQAGFVTSWRVLGPFANGEGSAFGKSFFNEAAPLPEKVDIDGKSLAWKAADAAGVPAVLDLTAQFDQKENVAAYAATTIKATQAMDVLLLLGSDDGCEVWVNGQKVHATNAPRGLTVDCDRVAAKLAAGDNTLLVKVLQGGAAWQLCVRFADTSAKAFDMAKPELAPR